MKIRTGKNNAVVKRYVTDIPVLQDNYQELSDELCEMKFTVYRIG